MDPLHLSRARELLGPLELERVVGAAGRLITRDGRACWLKAHRPGRAWHQAERGHEVVIPARRAAGVPVPERLASWPDARVQLLSEVPGRPGAMDDPPEVFEALGRVLRVLHALPCPQDPLGLGAAMVARARAAAARWPGPESARVLDALGDGGALDEPRVWCHRDVQARNWVVGPDGRVGLVDFEHLSPDHQTADFVRLEARGLAGARREALHRGYGGATEVGPALLLYGLQTVVWAREHGDAELEAIGLRALDGVR